MFKGIIVRTVSALFSALIASAAGAGSPALPYRPDHLLVVPKADGRIGLKSVRRAAGHKVKQHFEELGIDLLELPAGADPAAVAQQYMASGLVEFAEPDYRIHASEVPNDPDFSKCWGLNNSGGAVGKADADIRAQVAWNTQNSAKEIIVAVIDSGIRYTHEDLADNMWRNPKELPNGKDDDGNGIIDDIYGYNALEGSGDPWDDCGHGTHVAGTIGAVGNNGKGASGVCWQAQLMALKFMDSEGWGDTSDAIACINYARRNGAKVINASWGSSDNSYSLRSAINSARNAGIIFVTAAGNEASDNNRYPSYPASYKLDNVVSVAAINRYDEFDASYSNWGETSVDLAAPGTEIYSTSFSGDHDYEYMTGTSMATPHVAGAVALLRAAYPSESYSSILGRLYRGVDKLDDLKGRCVTESRLNIGNSIGTLRASGSPAIAGITVQSGVVHLSLTDPNASGTVERSADLKNWQPLIGASRNGGDLEFTEPSDHLQFYRVR